MTDVVEIYTEILNEMPAREPTAAALLTLAHVIMVKQFPDRAGAENFGHELAMALQAQRVRVSVDGHLDHTET